MGKSHRKNANYWDSEDYDGYDRSKTKKTNDIDRRKMKRLKNALRSKNLDTIRDYGDENY